jgi:hypothetical protein
MKTRLMGVLVAVSILGIARLTAADSASTPDEATPAKSDRLKVAKLDRDDDKQVEREKHREHEDKDNGKDAHSHKDPEKPKTRPYEPGDRDQRREYNPPPKHGSDKRDGNRGPAPDRSHADIGEAHRRLNHLMAAAQNLHEAGLHELAERVQREGEALRQKLGNHMSEGPAREHRREMRRPEQPMRGRGMIGRERGGMRQEHLEAEVRELRQTVNELRERLEKERRGRQ